MAGLDRPSEGRIALGAEVWFDARAGRHLDAEHRHVGYLPQDYGLFPHLTVAHNVRFAARRDRPDLLQRLGIAELANARPRDLSGGERQRAALARALGREPRLLLLDEPFGALDAITRRRVRDELGGLLTELALPSLLVTHSFEDAVALAQRIGVLDRGRLLALGTPEELTDRPATALVAELTGANVLDGEAQPTSRGSVISIAGCGTLTSSTQAAGPVRVAIYPWELEPADTGTFRDRVLAVHEDRGAIEVRLERVRIRIRPAEDGRISIAEGAPLALTAPPSSVRVLPPADG